MRAWAHGRHPVNAALPDPKRMTPEESNWDVKGDLAQAPESEMRKEREMRRGQMGSREMGKMIFLTSQATKPEHSAESLLFPSLLESRLCHSVLPPGVTDAPQAGACPQRHSLRGVRLVLDTEIGAGCLPDDPTCRPSLS